MTSDEIKMKTCSKCNLEFPNTLEYFYKHKINSNGEQLLKGYCKTCHKKKNKTYYDDNKEKIKEIYKKFYANNREDVLLKNRRYYLKKKHGIIV